MKYTKEQIEELKQIRYVKNVTSKSIIFTYEAKVKSLKLREKWLTSKEIFQELWFPEYVLNSKIPSQSICRWSRKKQTWIIEKKRWKEKTEKIDLNNMTLEQENEYLRTKLAILEDLSELLKSWDFP